MQSKLKSICSVNTQHSHSFCDQQLSVIEIELQSAIEERNRARQDASESNLAQDEVVSTFLC